MTLLLRGPATTQRLDPTEAAILSTLRTRRGQVVPIADLMPPPKWGDPRKRAALFRVRLCGLREKMRAAGFRAIWIETVARAGVRLVEGSR